MEPGPMSRLECRRCMKAKRTLSMLAMALCAIVLLGRAADTQAQTASAWTKLGSLPASAWGLASDGTNENTLYAFGSDGISRTTDGGTSWQLCNPDARNMTAVSPLPGQNT